METVRLLSDADMPLAGFGTWALRDAACADAVAAALRCGYRLIDTAQMYCNEDAVGEGIRRSGIPRGDIFLTTKVCSPRDSYEGAKAQIDRALSLLRTDYIDLFLIHEPYGRAAEMYRAMQEARAAGKIRSLGISNFSAARMDALIRETGEIPAVNQSEAHVFYPHKDLLRACRDRGVVMQAWSPFAEGQRRIFTHPTLTAVGRKYGKTAAQAALRYLIQLGIPVIPRTSRPERMRENLAVFDFALSAEDMAAIGALDGGRSLFGWY